MLIEEADPWITKRGSCDNHAYPLQTSALKQLQEEL